MGIDDDFTKKWKNARIRRERNPETGEIMEVVGVELGLPGRTFMRHRRCQNCLHFSTAEAALIHLNRCILRDIATLRREGRSRAGVTAHVAMLRRMARGFASGKVGRCQVIEQRTDPPRKDDFTESGYLCDRWSGSVTIDVPIGKDPIAEEHYAKLGETPPGYEEKADPKKEEGG